MRGIERLTFSPIETAEILGICINGVYRMLKSEQLNGVRIGRKILIPRTEIDRLLCCATPCYNKHQPIGPNEKIEI
jgi:excisionase family DNA binding protein